MAALFRWLTALNVIGTVAVVLALLSGPSLLAYMLRGPESVEIQLVPMDPVPRAGAASPAVRLEVPSEFRTPDLEARPWEILPDGRVQLRD